MGRNRVMGFGRRRGMGRWAAQLVTAVALVTTAVVVPGVLPALAASAWPDDVALVAARLETDPLGDPVAVHLSWPAAAEPVDGFQVLRDGVVVTNAGPAATGAIDPGVAGAGKLGFRYEVRALSGPDVIDQLGPLDVTFPMSGSECTRVWTGAVSSSWHEGGNWASVGAAAGEPGAPKVDDHACATTTARWPITVDQAGAVTKHFTSTLPSSLPTLRIATGGTLDVGGALKSYSLQLAGGNISIAEDSLLIEAASRAPLELGGGTLALGGTLRGTHPTNGSLQGAVTTVADTTTTLVGGRLEMELLRFDAAHKRTIVGAGGIEVAVPVVRLNGTSNLEFGPGGGATLLAGTIDDTTGTSATTIEWIIDRFDPDVPQQVLADGTMELTDLVELEPVAPGPGEDPDTYWDADVNVRGALTLAEPVTGITQATASGAGASVRSGGNPTPWAGIADFFVLRLENQANVALDGDLRTFGLGLSSSSTLDVAGTILDPNDGAVDPELPLEANLTKGTLRLGEPWEVPERGQVSYGEVLIDATILNRGDLYPFVGETAVPLATITGDLTVVEGASIAGFADGPGLEQVSSLTVEGTFTVDGSVYLSSSDGPDDLDVLVVSTPNEKPQGTPIDIAASRGESDPRPLALDIRDDGYHLVGSGVGGDASWDDADAIQVTSVVVDGAGDPVEVGLEWPLPTGSPAELVVERTELGTATDVAVLAPDATSFVDTDPVTNATYRIVARNGSGDEVAALGSARVPYPSALGCTIVWTHSAAGVDTAGDWSDARNWAPYGLVGSDSLAEGVRIPTLQDQACISSGLDDEGVIVEVDESGTVVGSVVGDGAVLGIDRLASSPGTTFVAAGDVEIERVLVNGGAVVGVGGDLGLEYLDVADGSSLAVGGALEHVDLDASIEPGAQIDGSTVQTGGWTLPEGSALNVLGESEVRGPVTVNGILLLDPSSQVDMDALETTSTAQLTVGVEGVVDPPQLRVTDAELDGTFRVLLLEELPDPADLLLVATANPSAATPSFVVLGETTGARIEADATGLRVVRGSSAWDAGDAVQATAVVVDDDGAPESVALSWPAPSGRPSRFEIVRSALGGETVVGTVGGGTRTFVDGDPLVRATYSVRAFVADGAGFTKTDTLGLAEVVYPATLGCTMVWTHSAAGTSSDGRWSDARNWAPYGTAAAASIAAGVRVPTALDQVCIDASGPGAGVIVDVDEPGAVAASITGPSAYIAVNRIDGAAPASLVVGGSVELERLGTYEQGSASIGGDLLATLVLGSGPDASLVVTGEIGHRDGRVGLVKGAILDGAAASSAGWTLPEGSTLELDGGSTIVGPVTAEGAIEVASGAEVTIDELATGPATTWDLAVDTIAAAPLVEVPFGLTLDGSVTVDLGEELANPSELHLVVSGAPMLGTAATSVTGASAGARVQLADDGIRVVRNAPEWGPDTAISVTAMTVDGDGAPVSVALKWPVPIAQADRFEIVRTAFGIDQVIGTTADGFEKTFVDDGPLPQATYSVRAIAGTEPADAIGPVTVAFPAELSCTIVATASADPTGAADWHDDRTWAPYGLAGSASLLAGIRTPSTDDHACVDLGSTGARRTVEVVTPVSIARLTGGSSTTLRATADLDVAQGASLSQLVAESGATVDVRGDLGVEHVALADGSELVVGGKVFQPAPATAVDDPDRRWGASVADGRVASPSPWTVPAGATLELGQATLDVELIVEGTVELLGGADVQASAALALGAAATVRTQVDPASPPNVAIDGELALDGTLEVELLAPLASGAELTLVTAGSVTGGLDAASITGAATDTEIVVDGTGIKLVRTSVGQCAEVPDAAGLPVEGCWVEGPDDTYTAAPDPADPDTLPRLGGVFLDPDDGVGLVLDLGSTPPTLVSDGSVAVGIDVALPNRIGRWSVGSGTLDWDLGGPVALPTDRFFNARLAGAPTLTPAAGGWQARLRLPLPGLLHGAIADLSGTIGASGRLSNPAGTTGRTNVAEFGVANGIRVVYGDVNRWQVTTPNPGIDTAVTGQFQLGINGPVAGTLTLDGFGGALGSLTDLDGITLTLNGVTGAWTADLDGTSGSRELRLLDTGTGIGVGSHLDLGSISVGLREQVGPIRIAKGVSGGWGLPTLPTPGALLQGLDLSFRDGALIAGRIQFGDPASGNPATPPIANAGGWLPVGGLTITHEPVEDIWTVAGFLDEPRAEVVGTIDLDNGRVVAGSLQIPNVNLGSLAVLDLTLAVTAERSYAVTAVLEGPGLTGRPNGTGSLTFAPGGGLTAGSLSFAQLPVGELFTIEQFRLLWSSSQGRWAASGSIDGPDPAAPPTELGGGLTFVGGVLTAADLAVDELRFGPLAVDAFTMTLARTGSSGPRESAFALSGSVRGPAREDRDLVASTEPVTGSVRLLDGRLTAFSLAVPHVELPGLVYLDDLSVTYAQDGTTATLAGAGTVSSAGDGGGAGPAATFGARIDDGRLLEATISLDRLPLGGMLTVEDFVATYTSVGEVASCAPVIARDAEIYAVSGSVRGSAATGCLAFDRSRLVGARLAVGQLQVGELLAVDSFVATYLSSTPYTVTLEGDDRAGTATLHRTSLTLAGSIAARGGAPTNFAGSMVLADGGVESMQLTADVIPLSSTIRLEDVAVAFDGGDRFDGREDRAFSISGSAVHGGGTTTLDGELAFAADGQLQTAAVEVGDVDFGPVVLESFAFLFDRGESETKWAASAEVSAPDDRAAIAEVSGLATFVDGALVDADLNIPRLSVGEIVLVTNLALGFSRDGSRAETWAGTGQVSGQGQQASPARAAFSLVLGPDGGFRSGLIDIANVRWGGLFNLEQLTFTGSAEAREVSWAVAAKLSVGSGPPADVAGSLQLRDGRAVAGSVIMSNLSIAELVRIERLDLIATDRDGVTTWEARTTVAFGEGTPVTTNGSMAFERGLLTEASLALGNAPIGELFRLNSFRLDYEQGRLWSASATVADEDGTSTMGGSIEFTDGRATSGSLSIANLQFGPLELSTLDLDIGSADAPGPAVCGVADTAGPGTRYALSATVRSRDGDTTSLAGRLRLDEGNFAEGRLCGSNLKFGDLLILDSVDLAYSSTVGASGRTISFTGSAVAENPSTGGTSSASVAFAIRDRQLQTLSVTATGIEVGDLLKLANLEFSYDRSESATAWAFSATIVQDGPDATLGGDLTVADGTITGGSLEASEVRFGDLFVLEEMEIGYFGREQFVVGSGAVSAGGNSSCNATPDDSNVPSGIVRGTGSYSLFSVSAVVRANDDTFAATGRLLFGDGDLAGFDVTLACLPLGDFKTLEAVRVAKRPGQLEFSGRLQDPDGTSSATGSFVFDDGRLTGGQVRLREVPIGPIQINRLDVVIGQTATGTTEYGLTVVLAAGDSAPVGGGGSLVMDDGRVVGGSIDLSGIKVFDLFRIDELVLDIDGSVPGRVRFGIGLDIAIPPGGGSGGRGGHIGDGADEADGGGLEVSVALTMVDGQVTAGTFTLGAIKLFDAVPLGRVSAEFDGVERRWAASLEMQIGQNGPAFVLGAEFERGKLLSGTVGFDLNGDGEPDGSPGQAPPSGGNAQMSWFPLKAAYLVYCSSAATASYCPGNGVSQWAGRLGIELPTDGAPAIDVSVDIRDGILVQATSYINFGATGIMVYPPVWLQSIGFGFGLKPFNAYGEIGVALGTGVVDIASVVGWVAAGEGPPLADDQSPVGYEGDYIYFASGGTVELFNLPVGGEFVSIFQSNGYLGFGGSVGIDVAGDALTILGGIEGAIFNASGQGFDLTNPETGQRLTGWHAQAHGFVEASVLGINLASADAYISDIGATAFAQIAFLGCTGVGIYWSSGNVTETCDYGRYIVDGVNPTDSPLIPNGTATGNAARSVGTSAAAEVEFDEFEVAPGEDVLGVTVSGFGSVLEEDDPTPDVALMAPDGTVYGAGNVDDDDPSDGSIIASAPNNRWFFIDDPQPGTWRVESAPGSVPIEEVALSRKLPPVDVRGSVTQAGGQAVIDYDLTPIDGQEVLFFERSVGETDVFESGIGTATGPSGEIRFTPAGDGRSGTREVLAVVMQEGFRRQEVSLGTFEMGPGQPASEPRAVRATEIAGGARVTWQPPADDGGRRITSYRVFSDLGFDVTVDSQDLGVDVPIPAMEPGEEIPVYVEARTGMGWGYSGSTSFTSTQTTPWQYEQYQVPRSTWVDGPTDLGPIDPVDPVDPVDPTDPTDPTDPDGPGPGSPGGPSTGPTTPIGTLARTGSDLLATWWWGVVLVLLGSALVAFGRRRRADAPSGSS